jgi:hypothetical protein
VTYVFPFAKVSGDKPPRASGDRPPRRNHPRKLHFRGARYRGTPPLDEELRPRRDGGSSPIRRKGGTWYVTGAPPHGVLFNHGIVID